MMRLAVVMLFTATAALAADLQPVKDAGPYVPSPQSVVSDMLRYAEVGPNDFLIDLGSGDGRIVLTAAKLFGTRGFGVEIKENLVRRANEAAHKEGLADRVKFVKADLFKTDISQATVITMYLLPDTVNLLKEKFLAELRPGTRIVSHDYPLTGWIPEKYVQMDLEDKIQISGVTTTLIYLYVVPAKVAGRWNAQMPPAVSRQPATLRSVGYDEKTRTLEVEMSNGEVFQYGGVYPEVYRQFMAAPNPSAFFDDKIAEEYSALRV